MAADVVPYMTSAAIYNSCLRSVGSKLTLRRWQGYAEQGQIHQTINVGVVKVPEKALPEVMGIKTLCPGKDSASHVGFPNPGDGKWERLPTCIGSGKQWLSSPSCDAVAR